jgi:hypothetical protein
VGYTSGLVAKVTLWRVGSQDGFQTHHHGLLKTIRAQPDDAAPCGSTFPWHVAIKADKKDKNLVANEQSLIQKPGQSAWSICSGPQHMGRDTAGYATQGKQVPVSGNRKSTGSIILFHNSARLALNTSSAIHL